MSNTVKITESKLKYLLINSFTEEPYLYNKIEIIKNLNDLLSAEAMINMINETLKAPADIVNILYGMGVKPAVKIIQKLYISYFSFML